MRKKARSDRSGDYGRFLATCALFKDIFSIDWLIDFFSAERPTKILAYIEEGEKEGLLVREKLGHYKFVDEEEQEKWRRSLPHNEQSRLRKQVAAILKRELPEDKQKVLALAHHFLHVSNDIESCRCLIEGGDLYRKAFRTEDALLCYSKVLEDLSKQRGEEEDRLFSETAINYSKISTARHDTEKVLKVLHEALERAEKWKMQRLEALVKMQIAKNEWLRSRYRLALKHFEEGWTLAQKLNDPGLIRSATTFSTFFLFWQGRFREAVQIYEKSVPDIEKYPKGGFPLLATMTVGYCYAQVGQVTQGLGMLDGIRTYCLEKDNFYMASFTHGNMGIILLDIGRVDEAIKFLKKSEKEAEKVHNDWVIINGKLWMAYAYYSKGEIEKCCNYIHEFLKKSEKVHSTVYIYPYLLEICLEIKKGLFPEIEGLSIERLVQNMKKGKNIFLKGVAYRYDGILKQIEGRPHEKIVQSLKKSLSLLEESGQQIELAKTRFELARYHFSIGKKEKAKSLALIGTKALSSINEDLAPDDIQALIKDRSVKENILQKILKLGKEIVAIRDNRDLVQHIISTVNQITGAERGAIFLLKENSAPPVPLLRASRNLTSDQISAKSFLASMEMIEKVATTGQGCIFSLDTRQSHRLRGNEVIRSRICVPMTLRDKTVGVLYHDNLLLSSAFKESDLELLSYFATLAAFALDNTKAYEEVNRLNQILSEENLYLKEEHLQNFHFDDIVGESSAIKHVFSQIEQVRETDTTVMITGETGVGKELVARAIHFHSPRSDKPFVKVNCSAFAEGLLPSELFGHEKGAFTGAISRRIGRFELANHGTLFLDEIGDISLDMQVRLLRVLQTKEFERVGGNETIRSDFRLVVATNRDLKQDVSTGKFREDLYYRLAVFPIDVPPLRDRRDDIPLLTHYFIKIYSQKQGKIFSKIPNLEMKKLIQYDWPGNIRELENIIERMAILNHGPIFRIFELETDNHKSPFRKDILTLKENEKLHIISVLQKTGWRIRGKGGAAELLDLPPTTLAHRMKKAGIKRPQKTGSRVS